MIGWSVGWSVGSELGSDVVGLPGSVVESDEGPVPGSVAESEAVGGVVAPSVTPDVGAVLGPLVRDGSVPGESVPVRPWREPGPPPGPDPPGLAGPVALCSGRSSPPAVSEAGFASMAWAPTYTATEATAVSITPPTAVTAV